MTLKERLDCSGSGQCDSGSISSGTCTTAGGSSSRYTCSNNYVVLAYYDTSDCSGGPNTVSSTISGGCTTTGDFSVSVSCGGSTAPSSSRLETCTYSGANCTGTPTSCSAVPIDSCSGSSYGGSVSSYRAKCSGSSITTYTYTSMDCSGTAAATSSVKDGMCVSSGSVSVKTRCTGSSPYVYKRKVLVCSYPQDGCEVDGSCVYIDSGSCSEGNTYTCSGSQVEVSRYVSIDCSGSPSTSVTVTSSNCTYSPTSGKYITASCISSSYNLSTSIGVVLLLLTLFLLD